jgi:hypothetical protein
MLSVADLERERQWCDLLIIIRTRSVIMFVALLFHYQSAAKINFNCPLIVYGTIPIIYVAMKYAILLCRGYQLNGRERKVDVYLGKKYLFSNNRRLSAFQLKVWPMTFD